MQGGSGRKRALPEKFKDYALGFNQPVPEPAIALQKVQNTNIGVRARAVASTSSGNSSQLPLDRFNDGGELPQGRQRGCDEAVASGSCYTLERGTEKRGRKGKPARAPLAGHLLLPAGALPPEEHARLSTRRQPRQLTGPYGGPAGMGNAAPSVSEACSTGADALSAGMVQVLIDGKPHHARVDPGVMGYQRCIAHGRVSGLPMVPVYNPVKFRLRSLAELSASAPRAWHSEALQWAQETGRDPVEWLALRVPCDESDDDGRSGSATEGCGAGEVAHDEVGSGAVKQEQADCGAEGSVKPPVRGEEAPRSSLVGSPVQGEELPRGSRLPRRAAAGVSRATAAVRGVGMFEVVQVDEDMTAGRARRKAAKRAAAPGPAAEPHDAAPGLAAEPRAAARVKTARKPRAVAPGEQRRRQFGPRSTHSAYKGVTQYKRTGRWEAHIWLSNCKQNGKGMQVHLGTFLTAEMAASAYDRAAYRVRGPGEPLNFGDVDYSKDPLLLSMKDASWSDMVLELRRNGIQDITQAKRAGNLPQPRSNQENASSGDASHPSLPKRRRKRKAGPPRLPTRVPSPEPDTQCGTEERRMQQCVSQQLGAETCDSVQAGGAPEEVSGTGCEGQQGKEKPGLWAGVLGAMASLMPIKKT